MEEGVRADKNSFTLTTALQKLRDSGLTPRCRSMRFFAMPSSIAFPKSLRLCQLHCPICDTEIKIRSHKLQKSGRSELQNETMIMVRITGFD